MTLSAEIITAITALIVAITGPAIVPKVIDAYKAGKSGKAARQKAENRSALGRVIDLEDDLEDERDYRRQWEDFAGTLRWMLKQLGVAEDKIPPWPVRKSRADA
jgi:hypothetical protein